MSTGNLVDPSEVEELTDILVGTAGPDFTMMVFVIFFYGVHTMLFSLYVYLQIQQRGQKRYYQISVLLLYMLATAALVLTILGYNQETLFIISILLGGDPLTDPAQGHFSALNNIGTAEAAVYVAAK
ncbi:hypothetical protein BDP27DRAFT_1424607 [Rhodocollybia butyracea]|uniref:Uncharacterized protein n=1 Tax=Rhodocollybia butyracea TaxID=206335 RepID=A0A9P5U5C0_9AGAR|nr:hypothetical protein BDP27DRAFT_1424607 [Rhodocollybia butyracea]